MTPTEAAEQRAQAEALAATRPAATWPTGWQNGLAEAVSRMREHLGSKVPIRFDGRDRMALEYILDRAERKCTSCHEELTLCPHCSGGDSSEDAGSGQGGYYLCQDKECGRYEICCGC